MADIANDLRATSDGLVRDLEALSAIEAQKRTLEPGSAEAAEAQALSDHLREEYRRAHEALRG